MTITKIIEVKLSEMREFATNNGYLIAVYQKGDNGCWYLIEEIIDYLDLLDDDTVIVCNNIGGIDFREVITEDRQYVLKLHNNFNLPKVIPFFAER